MKKKTTIKFQSQNMTMYTPLEKESSYVIFTAATATLINAINAARVITAASDAVDVVTYNAAKASFDSNNAAAEVDVYFDAKAAWKNTLAAAIVVASDAYVAAAAIKAANRAVSAAKDNLDAAYARLKSMEKYPSRSLKQSNKKSK